MYLVVDQLWPRLADRLAMVCPRVDVKKTASAHDLRRAFGERWAARLMPAQLMELMRHDTIETTLSYDVGCNAERTAAILWHEHEKATAPEQKAAAKKPRAKWGRTST